MSAATTQRETDYGRLIIGSNAALYTKAVALAEAQRARTTGRAFTWALTGGSSPLDWYRWCVAQRALSAGLRQDTHFTVSDERYVPLQSDQSNFGNADRALFAPLGVPAAHRHPWPVSAAPLAAADGYAQSWRELAGAGRAYDVCILGMGDDGHTASIFPGSSLLKEDGGKLFTAIDVPGKGWRLTITPTGLAACGLIVLMTSGAAKAAVLKQIFHGPYQPDVTPVQIMKNWNDRVVWLIDDAAAAGL